MPHSYVWNVKPCHLHWDSSLILQKSPIAPQSALYQNYMLLLIEQRPNRNFSPGISLHASVWVTYVRLVGWTFLGSMWRWLTVRMSFFVEPSIRMKSTFIWRRQSEIASSITMWWPKTMNFCFSFRRPLMYALDKRSEKNECRDNATILKLYT